MIVGSLVTNGGGRVERDYCVFMSVYGEVIRSSIWFSWKKLVSIFVVFGK